MLTQHDDLDASLEADTNKCVEASKVEYITHKELWPANIGSTESIITTLSVGRDMWTCGLDAIGKWCVTLPRERTLNVPRRPKLPETLGTYGDPSASLTAVTAFAVVCTQTILKQREHLEGPGLCAMINGCSQVMWRGDDLP